MFNLVFCTRIVGTHIASIAVVVRLWVALVVTVLAFLTYLARVSALLSNIFVEGTWGTSLRHPCAHAAIVTCRAYPKPLFYFT